MRRRGFAGQRYYCPICGSALRTFLPLNRPYHRYCPVCRSLQRHRLVWLLLERRSLLKGVGRVLHIAPEAALSAKLQAAARDLYLSVDLAMPSAMARMDITQLALPSQSFDLLYCSHVLEHVPDDRAAMREFRRVLRRGGVAIILVPISGSTTFEDASITDPLERERLFGQFDHVRSYGLDIEERLQEAGFEVERVTTSDLANKEEMERFGLEEEPIFLCRAR